MRKILNINGDWYFTKRTFATVPKAPDESWERVDLPHTWNAKDGQDGGNDYYRGTCMYAKSLPRVSIPTAERYYLEFRGANSSADVYIDGKLLAHHDGGYSTWRVEVTDALSDTSHIIVAVDNSPNGTVYPQMADFTFYGGLYRDVNLICTAETHFDLEYYGGTGLMITPAIDGKNANVEVEVFVENFKPNQLISYTVYDKEGREIAKKVTSDTKTSLTVKNAVLWHGRRNPYLYSCEVKIIEGERVVDDVRSRFGCRSIAIDAERGFILNGEEYALRGVSRHQDRIGVGNALLPEHHREDIELIAEVGATTVRLAHYQHDSYFYDLCDEYGLVVWAEIPYISRHMQNGRENTLSQLRELIIQNYNHPSIAVWGLSNEITIGGTDSDLIENHKILNDTAHQMDKTRLTAVAAVSMCDPDDPYLKIPDAVSFNHYFGWYGGDTDMNGPWFDKFHKMHPDIPIGCSEYGCEALNWHTSNPKQGDYTEEYQAYYHEELIKQLFTRKYLWATHVWNMFDFGADARAEGGENGQNHKGLVTIDRKYKKDAFYAYKAWLSAEPFVHLCGKRYVDRPEAVTRVTVYSNQPEVELFVNGESVGKKCAVDHFFRFEVKNEGESVICARAGKLCDEGKIRKVDKMNMDYVLKEQGAVLNWFDVREIEGRYSLNDKISDIMASPVGACWFLSFCKTLESKMRAKKESERAGDKSSRGFDIDISSEGFMQMMGGFTVLRLSGMLGMADISFSKEELLEINTQLNEIEK